MRKIHTNNLKRPGIIFHNMSAKENDEESLSHDGAILHRTGHGFYVTLVTLDFLLESARFSLDAFDGHTLLARSVPPLHDLHALPIHVDQIDAPATARNFYDGLSGWEVEFREKDFGRHLLICGCGCNE